MDEYYCYGKRRKERRKLEDSSGARIASRAITGITQRVINILVLITASPTPLLLFIFATTSLRFVDTHAHTHARGATVEKSSFSETRAPVIFAGTKEDTARGLGGPGPPQLSGINIGYFPIYRAFSRV